MGRVFQATYTKFVRELGHRIPAKTAAWYIEFTNALGKRVRRKAAMTKEQAKNALAKAESDVLNQKNGLPSQSAVDLSCPELRQRYLMSLKTRVSSGHYKQVESYTKELLNACRIATVRELKPEEIERYLDALSREQGFGAKALNERLSALKAMFNWSVRARLIPYNPIDWVKPRDVNASRRRIRRPLSDSEIGRLFEAALQGPLRRTLRQHENRPRKDGTYKTVELKPVVVQRLIDEGRRQVLAYRLMVEAGLRKSEVGNVTWNDLDLEAGTITTDPNWFGNKNGKRETLPLAPGLWAELRNWRKSHSKCGNTPIVPVTSRFLEKFDDDLCAAGIAKRVPMDENNKAIPTDAQGRPLRTPAYYLIDKSDSQGHTVDLHALRHTFATRLSRTPGIDPKSVQTLLRHATPNISFSIYVHASQERLRESLGRMPEISLAAGSDGEQRFSE